MVSTPIVARLREVRLWVDGSASVSDAHQAADLIESLCEALKTARADILSYANARWSESEHIEDADLVGSIDAVLAKAVQS